MAATIYDDKNKPHAQNDDNIYYNVDIPNLDKVIPIRANFTSNRVAPIIKQPANRYQCAIVRFSIPAVSIPLFFFTANFYKITMLYGPHIVTAPLIFIPNEASPSMYGKPTIWAYQEVCDMMNIAMTTVFNAIKALAPAAPPTLPPFIAYDADTALFSIYAQPSYDPAVGPATIELYFNQVLFNLMPAFQCFEYGEVVDPNRAVWIYLKNNKTNTVTINAIQYLQMKQEYSTVYLMYDLQNIAFETNMPLSPEMLPSQNGNNRIIITDFEPDSTTPSRETLQFFAQAHVRWYDIVSSYELSNITINVVWIDKKRNVYPIFIDINQVLTCKIQFRRRLDITHDRVLNRDTR